MNGGIVLLIVVLGLFLAAGILIAVMWGRPLLPKGKRQVRVDGSYQVTAVFEITPHPQAANACLQALLAMVKCSEVVRKDTPHICVWFLSDAAYEARAPKYTKSAAYLTNARFFVGRRAYPLIVVHEDYQKLVRDTGNPVIHELVHVSAGALTSLGGRGHSDPELWAAVGGSKSLEVRAKRLFLNLKISSEIEREGPK